MDCNTERGAAVAERTIALGHALRARGVAVSLSEIIDSTLAVTVVDLTSRTQLREALRATLVKDALHQQLFDHEFDLHFPARLREAQPDADAGDRRPDLVDAMVTGQGLGAAARTLVDEHAGLDGELRTERHHAQRVFHGADIARLMSRARLAGAGVDTSELRDRIDELKRLVASDVRSRLVASGATDPIPPDVRDIDFLEASRSELDEMRRSIQPIARKLAARLGRRRRHRAGRVNLRRTARRSLATGGVPIDVAHDRRRPHRPELFVLCDISGSVADVSLFTLTLMAALSAEIARTRSFVFVDAVDEVTELLGSSGHAIEPWQLMRNTNAVAADGHSDYGAVFEQFWTDVGETDLSQSSTVIITGDARTNYRSSGAEWLARARERARHVYWLNPDRRSDWGSHDSATDTFAPVCSGMYEVRNLRQLVACVERLL